MDPEAIAREQRRKQVEEALDDERGRETALVERLAQVVGETEGPKVDEEVFARLGPDDAAIVREALELPPADAYEPDDDYLLSIESGFDDGDGTDEEIAHLQEEIADCRRRQLAFRRYLDALDA